VTSVPFKFRRFSTRLLVLLLGLLAAVLGTTYALVSHANQVTAMDNAAHNLRVAGGIFDETVQRNIAHLAATAGLMTSDFTIKRFFTQPEKPNPETLATVLESYTGRVDSDVILLLANDEDRTLLANSEGAMENENLPPFQVLSRQPDEAQHGFSYFKKQLSVLVVVPLYAPRPKVAAWFGLTFAIDRTFADNLKRTTLADVTFVATDGPKSRVLASTLPDDAAQRVAVEARTSLGRTVPFLFNLSDDRYVTLFMRQPMLGEDAITIVLQRPLSPELAAARKLERYLLFVSVAAFVVATLAAFWIARGVSRPVLALAEHTKVIAGGDYDRRIDLRRADELGQLATAFNDMSTGLAERDRVRDLLDKNVSPEVATQLLRDGATLGGEEREVTILFADLRGFTTLSEKFAPRELLTLLNRYLDRMSGEIEKQGGVIDKFIGDGIMALFGAPVAQGDAADRALAAALAMERALGDLNGELAAEGRPPLGVGIGVNTARVIAGNIGSHRRLNYSVIGDGVNVASRLQSETRKPEHRTNIITSAATLAACRARPTVRALGPVLVKGRNEPVEIFAVES
jgi:adenylate cyclase